MLAECSAAFDAIKTAVASMFELNGKKSRLFASKAADERSAFVIALKAVLNGEFVNGATPKFEGAMRDVNDRIGFEAKNGRVAGMTRVDGFRHFVETGKNVGIIRSAVLFSGFVRSRNVFERRRWIVRSRDGSEPVRIIV
jgi:hypothetical protein